MLESIYFFSKIISSIWNFANYLLLSVVLVSKDTEFALITGRHQDQEKVVLYLLRAFGYKIDLSYFNQMEGSSGISENRSLIRYWTEKVKLIEQIRENNDYICSMLRKHI